MANIKHSGDEKKKHADRLYAIYDLIPSDFLNKILLKNNTLSSSRIINVRYGKVVDFEILRLLEELCQENVETL